MPTMKKLSVVSLVVVLLLIISSITTFIAIMPDVKITPPAPEQYYTTAEYSGFYNTSDTSIIITASDGENADNVTLYYRYSANNMSNWYPGGDYLDSTLVDCIYGMQYPQRCWYDAEHQWLYIVRYNGNTLDIWNVSKQWDLKRITSLTDKTYFSRIHDVKAVNNWTYDGHDYGIIAFTLGGSGTTYFSTVQCNISTTPTILDSFSLGPHPYNQLGYLTYFINDTDHLIVICSEISNPGKFTILDCSDPANIENLSETQTVNPSPWAVNLIDNNHYVIMAGMTGSNRTTAMYDLSNLSHPTYAGYLDLPADLMRNWAWSSTANPTVLWTVNFSVLDNNKNFLKWFDISDPLHWVEHRGIQSNTNGEFFIDYDTNDWAAVRYSTYDNRGIATNESGILFYNINNPNNIFEAGSYYNSSITNCMHNGWFDMFNNRGFFLSYKSNTFFALNFTVNLSHSSSWQKVSTDTQTPWSWTFDFPNGTGYYEFCTRGQEKDNQEPFVNMVPDARVAKIPSPSSQSLDIQTITLRPNARGEVTQLDGNPSTNRNWENVRDRNLSHYNSITSNDTEYYDLYGVDNVSYAEIPICYVNVRAKTSGTSYEARLKIMTHDKIYNASDQVISSDGALSWNLSINPYTNANWTWEEINDLQIGNSLQDIQTNEPCCVYYIYATVFFVNNTTSKG